VPYQTLRNVNHLALKAARERADLTRDQACQATGISRNTIMRVEQGRQAPSENHLRVFAELYGVTYESLLFR